MKCSNVEIQTNSDKKSLENKEEQILHDDSMPNIIKLTAFDCQKSICYQYLALKKQISYSLRSRLWFS